MNPVFVVRSRRVVAPDGTRPAAVHVRGERVEAVASYDQVPAGARLLDAGDLVLMPGVVDSHVHVNEPGRAEWEGFATATRAAAAGGVTTIVDMPLNSVPATTTVAALEAKRAAARGRVTVDVAFWGGVVPGNADDVARLCEAGVAGFKCFLVPSGVDEFPAVGEEDIRASLPSIAQARLPLLVHAELPESIARAHAEMYDADFTRHHAWERSRPVDAEADAIDRLARLARDCGAHVHVVHVSAAESITRIRAARAAGVRLTAETCPHYLTFASEDVPDGATEFKCAPPIRGAAHRDALWAALATGDLDLVATDHSPCPPGMKRRASGSFLEAWGGIASLELGLAAVWTGLRGRGGSIDDLARWMCAAPARLAGLYPRKGAIAPGADADFVIWDPDATFTVEPERLRQRHKITPYAGLALAGTVRTTILRGEVIYDSGRVLENRGALVSRGEAARAEGFQER